MVRNWSKKASRRVDSDIIEKALPDVQGGKSICQTAKVRCRVD